MTPYEAVEKILTAKGRFGLVGSRKTPEDVLALMRRAGRVLCDLGIVGLSGEADGADLEFHNGARASARYQDIGFFAFIPWNGFRSSKDSPRLFHNPSNGIYNAQHFDTFEQTRVIAETARGSFAGLGPGGVALQMRNVFQVLTPTLEHPVHRIVGWAQPIGSGHKWAGGTNTAFQIALRYQVPIVNLYVEDVRRRFEHWLDQHDK